MPFYCFFYDLSYFATLLRFSHISEVTDLPLLHGEGPEFHKSNIALTLLGTRDRGCSPNKHTRLEAFAYHKIIKIHIHPTLSLKRKWKRNMALVRLEAKEYSR